MATKVSGASAPMRERRRSVEARLAALGTPGRPLRTPPPSGRLGADRYATPALCAALPELGPLFAGFGRYLGGRADLVARRDGRELLAIPDEAPSMTAADVDACLAHHLGRPRHQVFFEFDHTPRVIGLWSECFDAWLAPGVPVSVTVVRPGVDAHLADAPLLELLQPWFDVPAQAFRAAIDDFLQGLGRRLDQAAQAAAFATLASDASRLGDVLGAPVVFRDHCAPGVLTLERCAAESVADLRGSMHRPGPAESHGADLGRRITLAWLRLATRGQIVPYDFTEDDILVDGDRLLLRDAAFEPHSAGARRGWLGYITALSDDDPEAAADWMLAGAPGPAVERHEEGLRRRLRQAVPFRDGEWSGEDRLGELALAQWRMAQLAGWPLPQSHVRLYRGLYAVQTIVTALAPREDALVAALRDERFQAGLDSMRRVLDPLGPAASARFREALSMPRAIDGLLTLASEGRLRVKIDLPEGRQARDTRNRTVMLTATLVALTGMAMVARNVAPALGFAAERLAAVVVLVLGGWLLVAAARM